jgi:hypothetical protein
MPYEPHDAAKVAAAAKNADQAVRVIGAAAPLIALAVAGHANQDAVQFSYTSTAVIVRSLAPSLREINKELFGYLDKAFQEAGWERRISSTGGASSVGVHAYVPGWIPRL